MPGWHQQLNLNNYIRRQRFHLFLAGDVVLITGALLGASWVATGEVQPSFYSNQLWVMLVLSLAVKIPLIYWCSMYRISWRYVGTREIGALIAAVTLGTLGLAVVTTGAQVFNESVVSPNTSLFTILVVDYLLTLILLGGFRSAKRLTGEWFHRGSNGSLGRVLLVGAGDAGRQVARRLREDHTAKYRAVGFVDDAASKQGAALLGVRVVGTRQDIPELVRKLEVDELWIVMPSSSSYVVREVVELG